MSSVKKVAIIHPRGAHGADQGRPGRGDQGVGHRVRGTEHPRQRRLARRGAHPDASGGTLAALHPLGRMAEIGDIVEAVMCLVQAAFVAGEVLHVDGGQSAGF